MTRRGGLGRGLGALIPSAAPRPEEERDGGPEDAGPDITAAQPEPPVTAAATVPTTAAPATPPTPSSVAPAAERSDPVAPVVEPEALAAVGALAHLLELDPRLIRPNPRQPRDVFDEEELDLLAVSLRDVGMLQPLVVRPIPGDPGQYELIAGERRWRASQRAGLTAVPVIVRRTEDADLLKESLIENIHRVQLNPLEEAAAYEQLLVEFGVTQDELASRLGRSRPTVSNLLRLLRLPSSVQRRIAAGVLSAGHAKALLALPDAASQERLADRVVAEGMSVRATEEVVRLKLVEDGDGTPPARGSGGARKRMTAPGLIDLQDDLSDALMTRVRITMGARRGRLQIEFQSVDDLERIVGVIADGLGASSTDLRGGTPPVRTPIPVVAAGGASDAAVGGRGDRPATVTIDPDDDEELAGWSQRLAELTDHSDLLDDDEDDTH